MSETITKGSGNIFKDLGVSDPELALMKAKTALAITRTIRALGLTQTQAAERMGIDQPKVSSIVRGELRQFSGDRLLELSRKIGIDSTLTFSVPKSAGRGTLKVVEASPPRRRQRGRRLVAAQY